MKIKHKSFKEKKCDCCNWNNTEFFKLDGWDKDDWLCSNCFSEELFNSEANYQIIPKKQLSEVIKNGQKSNKR